MPFYKSPKEMFRSQKETAFSEISAETSVGTDVRVSLARVSLIQSRNSILSALAQILGAFLT